MNLKKYLGKIIEIKIDRPLGSKHPKYDFIYPINYGYIENTISGDGKEIDAYVLGVDKPLNEFEGKCIAIIKRKNDNENKLVVANKNFNLNEIKNLTHFQERNFDIDIIVYQ